MFRTEISIPQSPVRVSHKTPIITIGSCFSDCMGARFSEDKFQVLPNPFGTVYNPLSIAKLLSYAASNKLPDEDTYVQTHGLWANYDFHSAFSHENKDTLKARIEMAVQQTHSFLQETKWLIITLGTAFVYDRKDNDETVANCHKLPAKDFSKRLLTTEEIVSELNKTVAELSSQIKGLDVILTVSPVRHIKDTIEQNMVSKSTLRLATNQLEEQRDNIKYFPSYEIMMDDLRDYRFYKSDMIHPNDEAENYIWTKFSETYFDDITQDLLKEWTKIKAAVNHKPFNPDSANHQKFLKQTIDRLLQLHNKFDISAELEKLEKQLK